jgi:hypothetical protein
VLLCRYAADVADLIQGATPGTVAGFISETIQGVGGSVPLADGYLPEVYKVGHTQHSAAQRRSCHSTMQQAVCSMMKHPNLGTASTAVSMQG